ncbi:MAG: heme biosynthesis protein HemY [Gammaproteobacteria bacterium]|nr:heme biosynthesis protein HemY [Gammaproteobacteria bacterium]
MRGSILKLLLVLLTAGVAGALIAKDPGYVLMVWGDASLETSLWFAILLLFLGWLLWRMLAVSLGVLLGSRGSLAAWRHRRQERRTRQESTRGLLALLEGDWPRARKELDAAASHMEQPLLNQLGAARAAHGMGDAAGRDDYLEAARAGSPKAGLAIGITRAALELDDEQWEQALATLLKLRKEAPRNAEVLRMLRSTYEALEDWQALAGLLPDLRRAGVMDEADSAALERQVWCAELHRAARVDADRDGRQQALEQAFHRIPKALRKDPALLQAQVRELRGLNADAAAERLLRENLHSSWDDELISLYGWVQGGDPAAQLAEAEAWLTARPNNPALLLTLGRLAMRHHKWDKAREYLEASVAQHRTVEGEAELGRLLLHLGHHEAAARHFADSVRQMRTLLPELPLPEQPISHDGG